MNRISVSVILIIVSLISAFAEKETVYELKVGDFTKLSVVDGINVDYKCNPDSAGIAVFSATPDIASILMFTPKKSKLTIQLNTQGVEVKDIPALTVYSSRLDQIDNSGDSLVRVFSPIHDNKFTAKVIGNGRIAVHQIDVKEISASVLTGKGQIVLNGQCNKADYSVTGTGMIQADKMTANDVNCKIVGTGTIGCYVSGKLSIFGIGTGKVYYSGNPSEISSKSFGINGYNLDK